MQHILLTLRSPLNAISGWIYLMRDARKDETLMAQGLDVLQRNTNTLIELISDLLITSRIVAGTLTMELKEVDLKQVVRASVETLRLQAAEKGIAVTTLVEISEAVITAEGDEVRRFRSLKLEFDHLIAFPFVITVRHRIDETSPLFGMTRKSSPTEPIA